jgi:hypothetical protein
MNHHTMLGVQTPLLKDDSPRRIDRVIDYFGEGGSPASSGDVRTRESTGAVVASEPRGAEDDA